MAKTFKRAPILTASDISRGPAYAENILLAGSDFRSINSMPAAEKYSRLASYCSNKNIFEGQEAELAQRFYLGHFLEQQGRNSADCNEKNKLFAAALDHFTAWLRLESGYGEPLFYALLKSGELMETLEFPWSRAEDKLMNAFEAFPMRGEAIEAIVRHYLSAKQLHIAYIFSSYALKAYFLRAPSKAKWGLKESYYNWQVLDMHITACFKMDLMDEATPLFKQLMEHTRKKPALFRPSDIREIHAKAPLFNSVTMS